ncbi:hypothetical protein J4438_03380 [Candidatus Woesearchaeota archaeon]|nr:hypothetical protein [Candidatus Woesearchaeota archaeon]
MKQLIERAEKAALAEVYDFLQGNFSYHEQTQERVESWPRNGLSAYADYLHLFMSRYGVFEDLNYTILYDRYLEFRNGEHTRRELPINLNFGLPHEDVSFGRSAAKLATDETKERMEFIKQFLAITKQRLANCPAYGLEAQVRVMENFIRSHQDWWNIGFNLPLESRLTAFKEKLGRQDVI